MSDLPSLALYWPTTWEEYALLDSGNGERLERYGAVTLRRPEPNAPWAPRLPQAAWEAAEARFRPEATRGEEAWQAPPQLLEGWPVRYGELLVEARLTPFRHTGIFPEQAVNWEWCAEQIRAHPGEVRVLNLFAYTGIATLAAARAGAKVTHVDASRPAMGWARHNQALSGLEERPIRWLIDDVVKFVRREGRRGRHYEGIILDPPIFGRGPKGEVWRFADSLPALLEALQPLLSPAPAFVLLNAYAVQESALVLHNLLAQMVEGREGTILSGELALREQGDGGRLLPTSRFARWARG